jgi:hypothetical protein
MNEAVANFIVGALTGAFIVAAGVVTGAWARKSNDKNPNKPLPSA